MPKIYKPGKVAYVSFLSSQGSHMTALFSRVGTLVRR